MSYSCCKRRSSQSPFPLLTGKGSDSNYDCSQLNLFLTRLNVLDDLFSLIAAGKAKTSEGLRLLSAYKAEDSYIVWNNISSHLSQLATVIADQDCYADFDR